MKKLHLRTSRGLTVATMSRPLTVAPPKNGWRRHHIAHMLRNVTQNLTKKLGFRAFKNTLFQAFKSCNRGGKKVVTDRSVTGFRLRACVVTSVLYDRLQLFLVTEVYWTPHNSLIIKSVTGLQLLPI